ncbi:hypothetical protein EDB19DRAFT_1898412 [Suillus lakei]|nr:hypothetical protein EDB19DRAFT_1898412 [Suillus lakei]
MVGAFHGHAHNRKCQLNWHPMFITGTGHTEGEGCEHIFSSSNELVQSTRHASAFHWHQLIEEHFMFWDADKYAALNRLCIQYVEVLDDLEIHREEWNAAQSAANNALTTVGAGNFAEISAALMQAQIRVDTAYAKIQNMEALVAHMDIQLSIEECWAIGSADYLQFKEEEEATLGKYCAVLNELEHLMVMRLFELSKLSLSSTGSTHLTYFF